MLSCHMNETACIAESKASTGCMSFSEKCRSSPNRQRSQRTNLLVRPEAPGITALVDGGEYHQVMWWLILPSATLKSTRYPIKSSTVSSSIFPLPRAIRDSLSSIRTRMASTGSALLKNLNGDMALSPYAAFLASSMAFIRSHSAAIRSALVVGSPRVS